MIERKVSLFKSDYMFTTGDIPILITCTDLSDWICKHGRDSVSPLVNEIMGSSFAQNWNLRTPPICLIDVKADHIPTQYAPRLQPFFFNKPCFGSSLLKGGQVIDKTMLPSFIKSSFKRKILNKNDLLKIALFDIWIGNEDRHHGNSNLILDQTQKGEYYFNVFDHGAIFNTSGLRHGIDLITDNESLISSELVKILFGSVNNLTEIVDNIVQDFYLCTQSCEQDLNTILLKIPLEWDFNLIQFEDLLRDNIFNDDWYSQCEQHFRELIQTNLYNK
ncbi:HipA family kinase [Ulvibacter litoralis]|uniref:HipA-like kinase domain-containing protein n=1 Tax=Ulvibacter litoralis TaxID=227084 RepID=A0A1G7IJV5_9FLAO|nr:HipA family kinase [Ulvibacter litoralis]GHC61086.1 hypothetical protein GCM10008083_27730 [Ulvibacter litoralis]SDF13002.1 hypothetical protein SAMN05421855_10650 [Ulvibacter litoralis]